MKSLDCSHPVVLVDLAIPGEKMTLRPKIQPPPNYKKLVLAIADKMEPGTVTVLNIMHDDWCLALRGGLCRCTPVVEQSKCI